MNISETDITLEQNKSIEENRIQIKHSAKTVGGRILRRTVDIIVGILSMIVVIPITLIVAIVNKLSKQSGPLFYTAENRIGLNGKPFKMYKFRTMIVGADEKLKEMLEENEEYRKEYEEYKKIKNDPRITKVGKFLRKTSLDEFPQFFNVLKGDMTLVGPRPYLEREKEDMGEAYNEIIKSKPGITGKWEVSLSANTLKLDNVKGVH